MTNKQIQRSIRFAAPVLTAHFDEQKTHSILATMKSNYQTLAEEIPSFKSPFNRMLFKLGVDLLAYNSTSINLDDRAREMATMFAFGIRIRTALRVAIMENLLTNTLGIVLGCILGFMILVFMLTEVFASVIPDIELTIALQLLTFGAAALVGLLAAVLTPVLSVGRMTRMNIPAALRVME